jgi:hypothetical protein
MNKFKDFLAAMAALPDTHQAVNELRRITMDQATKTDLENFKNETASTIATERQQVEARIKTLEDRITELQNQNNNPDGITKADLDNALDELKRGVKGILVVESEQEQPEQPNPEQPEQPGEQS